MMVSTPAVQKGFDGHSPTLADWSLHLTTLFPETRLKNVIEVRRIADTERGKAVEQARVANDQRVLADNERPQV